MYITWRMVQNLIRYYRLSMARHTYPVDDMAVLRELGYSFTLRKRNFYTLPCPAIYTHCPLSICDQVRDYIDAEYYTLDHVYDNGWMYFPHLSME